MEALQVALRAKRLYAATVDGVPSGAVDGVLGARTDAALRRFQSWAGLAADGLAGRATISRLRAPPPMSPLIFAPPVAAPIGDAFGPRGNRFHSGVDYPVAAGRTIRLIRANPRMP